MIYLPDVDRFAVVFTTRRCYCRPETSDIQQIYAVNVLIIYAVTLGGAYPLGVYKVTGFVAVGGGLQCPEC